MVKPKKISIKKRITNFFTHGLHEKIKNPNTFDKITQLAFLKGTLLIGSLAMIITSSIYFLSGEYFEFIRNMIYAFTFLILLYITRFPRALTFICHFFIMYFLTGVYFSFTYGGMGSASLMYIFVFPILAFFLVGIKGGLFWISVYLLFHISFLILVDQGILTSAFTHDQLLLAGINMFIFNILCFFVAFRQKKVVDMLFDRIYLDQLTGLPNRNKLLEDLEEEQYHTIALINLDEFKHINGLFGYHAGDFILKTVAHYLQQKLPLEYKIYKLHGDEYAMLTNEEEDRLRGNLNGLITSIQSEVFIFEYSNLLVRLSIGVCQRKNTYTISDMYPSADMALKEAKNNYKSLVFFQELGKIKHDYISHLNQTKLIKDALEKDRVFPYFQPIVTNSTGEVVKYECLARLTDDYGKVYIPENFLEVAKQTKQYPRLTRVIFLKSINKFKDQSFSFSINLSVSDITDPYIKQYIFLLLHQHPHVCRRIIFEIIETEGFENIQKLNEFISEIKKLGCRMAIDDFGSGFSNFDYLMKTNIDILKIDGSLIKHLNTDKKALLLVKNIVSISHKMNVETIAEFVHSKEIFDIVKDLGITYSQGYYLGEPSHDIHPRTKIHRS